MNIALKFVRLFTAEARRALRSRREGRRNAPPTFSATPPRPPRLCGEKHRALFLYLSIGATFVAQMFYDQAEAGRFSQQITFNKHVAPILFANCAACHHSGGAGPFGLIEYQEVKKRARQIVTVTGSRYMPPWLPEPGYGDFADARRLSDEQIETIRRWVEQGMVEGDKTDLPQAM